MKKITTVFIAMVLLLSAVSIANAIDVPNGGIQEIPSPPVADAGGPYSANLGAPVYFDGSGSSDPNNDIVSYSWDFGDGSSGSGKYVTHTYDAAGVYNVTLTVTDDDGFSDTDDTTATITYTPPSITDVHADPNPTWLEASGWGWTTIYVTVSDGIPDFTYTFYYNGNTASEVTSERSTSKNIGFDTPGNYTVTVTVEDGNGYSDQEQITVTVLEDYFEVDANGPYYGHPGTPVEFHGDYEYTPGEMVSTTWYFGDGETAYGEDVTHTYDEEATFDVTFEVRKLGSSYIGTDTTTSIVKELDLQVDTPSQAPALTEVTYNIEAINAFGGQVKYDITFGDGETTTVYGGDSISVTHTYENEGVYDFNVVATDLIDTTPPYHNAQVSKTGVIQITPAGLYPDAGGPYDGFEEDEIQFDGSGSYYTNEYPIVSYEWDFGDGTTGTGVTPVHSYEQYGNYTVTLTVINSIGQKASDTSEAIVYEKYSGLVADAGKPYVGVVGQPVQFDGSNSNNALSYKWDFGDGTTGTGVKPKHVYNAPGEYTVTLTAKRLLKKAVDITTVKVFPADETPSQEYAYGGCFYQGNVNETLTFNSYSRGDFVEYIWDFGDGTTATGKTVTHSYDKKGSYLVTLTAKDKKGNEYRDVLHADVERSLTSLYDFLTTFGVSAGGGVLTGFSVYTRLYDPDTGLEIERTTPVSGFPVSVDVNNDGQNDITISRDSKLGIDRSQFSNLWVIVFRNQWQIQQLTNVIPEDFDFEIDIQFSLADWVLNIVGSDIEDNLFRVGYHSAAGEMMPTRITLKHTFVPYLIRHILHVQPDKTFPEYWSAMDVAGVGPDDSLSLVATFFVVKPSSIIEKKLSVHYDPVVTSIMQYRRGKYKGSWIREFGFARTQQSIIKFTYSKKENEDKWANVSFLIDRPREMTFKLEITPLAAGGGIVEYHSSQLLDMILFAESYDEQQQKTTYFYVKNLPTDIVVEWNPNPKDGYIDASTSTYKDLDIGLTDNLDENLATWKINVSNLPEHIHLEWDISVAGQISLLTENTGALSLDYFGWNREQMRTINFHVDTEEDIDVAAAWDLEQGWFKLTRSITLINFLFSVHQEPQGKNKELIVELTGSLSIKPSEEGLTIDFNDFENGRITITRGASNIAFSAGATIIQGNPAEPDFLVGVEAITLSAGADETEITIQWDDTPRFRVDVSTGAGISFDIQNFSMENSSSGFTMFIGSLSAGVSADGNGYAEITWDDSESKLGIGGGGGSALFRVKDFSTTVPALSLSMSIGLFEIQGSAHADIYLNNQGFDVSAEASINLENLSINTSEFLLSVGKFYLGGSGQGYIRKIDNHVEIQGSAEFDVGYVYLETSDSTIEINGLLHIGINGGKIVFDKQHIEFQGTGEINLQNCEFIIEGEHIQTNGYFDLNVQSGNIGVYWGDVIKITADAQGDCRLDVEDFLLSFGNITITSENITLYGTGYMEIRTDEVDNNQFIFSTDIDAGFSVEVFEIIINTNFDMKFDEFYIDGVGSATIQWGEEIDMAGDISFGLSGFYVEYNGKVVEIQGSIALDGVDCYLHLSKGHLQIGGVPSVYLDCTFIIEGDVIVITGDFDVEASSGYIDLTWDSTQGANITLEASAKLTVTNLELIYHDLTITSDSASLDVTGGYFGISWNKGLKQLDIQGDVAFTLQNLLLTYASDVEAFLSLFSVGGSGQFHVDEDHLYGDATGFLDLDELNFTIPSLYIYVGVFGVTGTGEGTVSWDDKLHLYGDADFGLENLILDSDTIDATLSGSLYVDANGYVDLAPGFIEMSVTGSVDFGAGGMFIINGEKTTIGGLYELSSGNGVIRINGTGDTDFKLDFIATGGPTLTVTSFYFDHKKWNLTSDTLIVSTEGGLIVHIDKGNKVFNLSGGVDFSFTNAIIKYENEPILTADLLGFGGGGSFEVEAKTVTTAKLDVNLNILSADDLYFEPPDSWGWKIDYISIGSLSLDTSGYASLSVVRSTTGKFLISGGLIASISLSDLEVLIPHASSSYRRLFLSVDSFSGDGGFTSKLGNFNNEPKIEFKIFGSASVSNFQFDFGETSDPREWHASVGSASGSADLWIQVWGNQKWYWFNGSAAFSVDNAYLNYDTLGYDYDSVVTLDSLSFTGEGYAKFFLRTVGSEKPYLKIGGNALIDLDDLYIGAGVGGSDTKEVTISDLYFNGNGELYSKWDTGYLKLDGDIDVQYNMDMSTTNYGTWHADGNIDGDATLEAYWDSSEQTGHADLTINSPGDITLLNIVHDDLTLNIGSLQLDSGSITFEWDRGDIGYFNILNSGVNANMDLCKIVYPPNQFEFKVGTIELRDGNTYINWQKNTSTGFVHVNNGITFDADLIKVKWGDKSVELGDFELKTGEFRLEWDTSDSSYKEVKIKNGIPSLRGGCTFIDGSQTWTLSVLQFEHDYSKTITFGWYKDGSSVIGVYLDTGGISLSDWVEFQTTDGNSGKKLKISGPKAEDFFIKKTNDKLKWGGHLQLGNYLQYSKLVNGAWQSIEAEWNID
ncbi:MAG: hypothetical protein DRN24_02365, partial [Thermoplasmata archaeon]